MIPFLEIQTLASKVRDKTGHSCCVRVEHWSWSHGDKGCQIQYSLAVHDTDIHTNFDTVTELKSAMNKILNPKEDVGVTVTEP